MNKSVYLPDEYEWGEIILKLTAYTEFLLSSKKWSRGDKTDIYVAGKEAKDYVYKAIEIYLLNPEKYKKGKRSLLTYLELHLIRTLISNDNKRIENKTNTDLNIYITNEQDEDEEIQINEELVNLGISEYFDEKIDYETLVAEIKNRIKGDTIVEQIFYGISRDYKRREICEEFKISINDYDNGIRRLRTLVKNRQNNLKSEKL